MLGYEVSSIAQLAKDYRPLRQTAKERLCRRSNLSATLATPGPGSYVDMHYPIPIEGGILSENVGKGSAVYFVFNPLF